MASSSLFAVLSQRFPDKTLVQTAKEIKTPLGGKKN
jgi:hypothetical protein